ncbi:cupin domain-containing protein [Oryzobacter telluris]|uniref:cupin domain-containing protein n=1 Tax=Oryzobacter telluris TaxID=3149179 RepID=UPI00370D2A9C
MSVGADRLLTADVAGHPLEHAALPADDVLEGTPTAAVTTLAEVGGTGVGLWEMTVGTARDTEVDEVFVVLAGRGTVTFEDGSVIDLVPGVAVRLRAGDRTTWVVTETLRKIWVA